MYLGHGVRAMGGKFRAGGQRFSDVAHFEVDPLLNKKTGLLVSGKVEHSRHHPPNLTRDPHGLLSREHRARERENK